ncbi:unnamed protein product [Rhodiola kirilowii]
MAGISNRLSEEMERIITAPYNELEVQDALFQMAPTKSPGLDGFSALFYQKHWEVVKDSVIRSVLHMLREGVVEDELNKTMITLVPKKKDPEKMEDYRPISLCNVAVKVVTKVLANRLKHILPVIISETQSAFVPGRLISDNILAAHELFHFIKSRSKQKVGFFALKLDMSKAYDRVEWDFLEMMLQRLGFPKVWVDCVMSCVCSVKYVVRVNDMGAPEISHLLFADDSMFFVKADVKNANSLKEVLKEYEVLSGQMINFSKSEIFFSQNVTEEVKGRICSILGVGQVDRISKYLGLPVMFSHNKTELFRFIIEKVWKRVQGWKEKTLSMAGKEILIKAVIQASPTYAMMCLRIPDQLIKRIVSIVSKYWWSNGGDSRGIHWCSFDKLCKAKTEGGLGFRELSIFNDALLAKQVWRLLHCEDSLTSRLLKSKYYREANVLNCNLGVRPSVAMRSIWYACNKVRQWIDIDEETQQPVWREESNGVFSTRSAYLKLKEAADVIKRNSIGEQADNRKVSSFWKIIWRLQVQPKVKIFSWRLYHDYLPSAKNLIRRGCQVPPCCALCGFEGESSIHSLLNCWWAGIFWRQLGVDCRFLLHNFEDPGDWLWFCAFNYSNVELATILQCARMVWYNRNLVTNGKEGLNPWITARNLKQRVLDFQNLTQRWIVTDPDKDLCWQAPRRGFVKLNVDGAWDRFSRRAGIGICGRDDLGIVWLVEARSVEDGSSCQEVEAKALLRALQIAEEKGLQKVIFETDSAEVFKAVMQGPGKECRILLDRNSEWSMNLIFREANSCADKLAREAREKDWNWINQVALPRCLFISV